MWCESFSLFSWLMLTSVLREFLDLYSTGPFSKYVCLSLSYDWLFVTPWTVAHQASLSMDFSRQEYCRESPFPSPRNLSNPGIEPGSPALQADSLLFEPPGKLEYTCFYIFLSVVTFLLVFHYYFKFKSVWRVGKKITSQYVATLFCYLKQIKVWRS